MTTGQNAPKQLPKGWMWTELDEICDPVEKVKPETEPEKEFIYLDIASIDNKKQKITNPLRYLGRNAPSRARQLLKRNDILFSTVRTYLRNIAIVDEAYDGQIASTGFCVIRPCKCVENKFIFYLVQTTDFVNALSRTQRGTSYPAVRESDIFAQRTPLAPFNEQVRIVARVDELFARSDAGIEGLRKVKAQLKRYRQAVLKYAFEGKLTEEWRRTHRDQIEPATKLLQQMKQERTEARNHELSPIEESDLPTLPDDWTWTTLNEVSQINMGQSPIGLSYNNSGRGVPLLNGPTEFGEEHPTAVQWTTSPTKICNRDDLLICVRGNTTGRMNWADQQYCIGRGLAAISPLENIVKCELLCYFLSMRVEEIMRRTRGSTFPNLKSDELHRFRFPLAPYIEQEELVERIETAFSTAHRLERNMATALLQSERLRQSILKAAFEGKLVPQDPSDEPAEKLLERIKEERAKSKGEKSSNRRGKNQPKQLELSTYVK